MDERAKRDQLERTLFGITGLTGAEIIALRDAQERASQAITPDQLAELMDRARMSGDVLMLRAGFAAAWRLSRNPLGSDGWGLLVGEYLSEHPTLTDAAHEYAQMTSIRGTTTGLGRRLTCLHVAAPHAQ